jgi:hypothetical protein
MEQVEQDRIVRVMIARNPSYPLYGVLVEYQDGRQLWDLGAMREADTLAAAALAYPDHPITLWDYPEHYSQVTP